MNYTSYEPIPFRPLFNDFWVFCLYGAVISMVLLVSASFGADTTLIEKVMMEPISIYAFGSLSLAGMLLLAVTHIALGTDPSRMRASCCVRCFFLPISNVGLSSGAIIAGMTLGLCMGTSLYSLCEPEVRQTATLLGGVAVLVLATLYPLYWMQRSLFDETKQEKDRSALIGGVYCALVLAALWFFSREAFWRYTALFVFLGSVGVGIYMRLKAKKANRIAESI